MYLHVANSMERVGTSGKLTSFTVEYENVGTLQEQEPDVSF